eukprot:scaffold298097_cov26-Prasinocladus_malaysianus.AAC.1
MMLHWCYFPPQSAIRMTVLMFGSSAAADVDHQDLMFFSVLAHCYCPTCIAQEFDDHDDIVMPCQYFSGSIGMVVIYS